MYVRTGTQSPPHRPGRGAVAHTISPLTREEMLIAACALSVTLCACLLPGIAARTQSPIATVAVRVSADDTLWGLARAHPAEQSTTAETVDMIRDLNGMKGSVIAVGEVLRVPAPTASRTALARR